MISYRLIISCLILAVSNCTLAAPNITPFQSALLPSTLEPSKIGEEVSPKPYPEQETPVFLPEPSRSPYMQALSPEMAKIKFKLNKLQIKNATVFSQDELLCPYQKYLGKTISILDLQTIAKELTLKYHKAGYILVQVIIPEQNIHEGFVSLRVINGYIASVTVTGNICKQIRGLLIKYGEHILASKPLHMSVIERYVLLANDIPGVNIKAVLKASKNKTGAADLVLVSQQKLETVFFSVNNFGTRFLGPRQYVISFEEDSILQAGDAAQIQNVTTANNELNYGQFRYSFLPCDNGLRIGSYGRYVRTEPGSILEPFDAYGLNKTIGIDATYPIIRGRKQDLFFNSGILFITSKADLLQTELYHDRIRPFFMGFIYNRIDALQGANHLEINATKGLKIFQASGDTNISRPGGRSRFVKLNGTFTRLQILPKNFSLFFIIQGQYSFEPLLAPMQFSYGGPELGRGYDPSELLGDKGLAGALEFRYDVACPPKVLPLIQYYIFYDAGTVWHTAPVINKDSATSTGAGIRVGFMQNGRAAFFVAKPISRRVIATNNKHARVFFTISLLF